MGKVKIKLVCESLTILTTGIHSVHYLVNKRGLLESIFSLWRAAAQKDVSCSHSALRQCPKPAQLCTRAPRERQSARFGEIAGGAHRDELERTMAVGPPGTWGNGTEAPHCRSSESSTSGEYGDAFEMLNTMR